MYIAQQESHVVIMRDSYMLNLCCRAQSEVGMPDHI